MIWLAIKRGVGLAVFLALAGIAALFAGTAQSDDAARFAGARTIDGTVTRLDKSQRQQGGSTSTTFRVFVSTPTGPHLEDVSGRFFNTLSEGQTVALRVLDGSDGSEYLLDPGGLQSSAIWALILGPLLLLAALALSAYAIRTARAERRGAVGA